MPALETNSSLPTHDDRQAARGGHPPPPITGNMGGPSPDLVVFVSGAA